LQLTPAAVRLRRFPEARRRRCCGAHRGVLVGGAVFFNASNSRDTHRWKTRMTSFQRKLESSALTRKSLDPSFRWD